MKTTPYHLLATTLLMALANMGCSKTAAPNPPAEAAKSAAQPSSARAICSASCSDATHAKACEDYGKVAVIDCGAQGRRCVNGVCGERICKPNELHCHEGQLQRCDASGSARKLETACRPDGVCLADPKQGGAKCVKSCDKSAENMVLAFYECGECDFKDVPFCAKKGSETACSESLCKGGELTFAAGMLECERQTDGLMVPGSEKRGTCEKGTALVQYEVCVDGKAEKRARVDGCQ